jgi:SLT domain-containing protein
MGADGAPLIAALVRASPAQFKRVANLLRRLDPSAFGGGQKVTRFAAGGIAPATMGGWRVFGEAGSDEAFIPLDRSKQARSRMLTADVAGRLGGQVTWSTHRVIPGATGVSAAPSSSVASGAGVSMNVGTVQLLRGGPEDVANDVMFRVRQLGG